MAKGKIWTTEEISYLKNNYLDNTNKILGKHLNRTESSIETKLGLLKLIRPRKCQFNENYFKTWSPNMGNL